MKTKQEMKEKLDAGYTLCDPDYPIATIRQIDGTNIIFDGEKVAICYINSQDHKDWEIQRPDLTKPQIVRLDHKGWAWDRYPEESDEVYLFSIEKDGLFHCWHNGKTAKEHDFDTDCLEIWENFSWEKPSEKKKVTFTLTEEQIEAVEEFLRGRK